VKIKREKKDNIKTLAPINDDTVFKVNDLLIPTKPRPVWTDTRAELGPRASQLGDEKWLL
jgi:hypothetical protein